MTSGGPGRATGFARALTLSWFAVTLAGVAHLAAGGSAPGITSSLVVGAFLTVVGMPLCRNAFRLTRHGPLLLLQQLATHAVLALTTAGHGASIRPTPRLAAALDNEHALHTSTTHLQHAGASSHTVATGHALIPSPLMVMAHLCAALTIAVLLMQAESGWATVRALAHGHTWTLGSLRSLVSRVAKTLVLTDLPTLVRRLPAFAEATGTPPPALTDLWRSPAPCRRGPPRPCAA